MKKIFIAFVAVACALSACSDDDTADDLSRATISITPDAIPAGPDGTTTQVTVTSSGDWRLAGVCDWVHPSAEAGKSGDVVTFTMIRIQAKRAVKRPSSSLRDRLSLP